MEPIRAILTATDLSPRADDALTRAAQLAREHGACLTALHVVDHVVGPDRPPENWVKLVFGPGGEVEAQVKREAEAALYGKLAALPGPAAARVQIVLGMPFVEIIRQAREARADLVVLGAHGRHFVKDWLIGTTAERVVRKGDRPVLVVKKPAKEAYRRALAALDFSDNSQQALAAAVRLAPGARFTLLHAYDFSFAPPPTGAVPAEALLRLQQEHEQAVRARLAAAARAAGLDPQAVELEVCYGYPALAIPTAAKMRRADLVAVGTSGLSGLRYVLLGSVAEHVLREAPADVLAVPPPVRAFELP